MAPDPSSSDFRHFCPMGWRDLYPFASRFLELNGHRLHYVDEGSGDALLFVHGNPTWSFYWRNLILGLRDRFRCIAVDHIGCGLSDKPQHYPYTLSQRIADLCELAVRLELTGVTLVAHDWGGAIGLGSALRLPQRYARIVLMNSGAFPPPFVPWRIAACRMPVLGTLAVRGLNVFARAALTMAASKPERMTADVCRGLLAPYDCWSHRVAIDAFVRDIPLTPRHPTWQVLAQIEAGLPRLADRPIQLIWGMQDWCFRLVCLERFIQYWPGAEVHRLEDCGHYVVEDGYERIVPLMADFLARNALQAAGMPASSASHA